MVQVACICMLDFIFLNRNCISQAMLDTDFVVEGSRPIFRERALKRMRVDGAAFRIRAFETRKCPEIFVLFFSILICGEVRGRFPPRPTISCRSHLKPHLPVGRLGCYFDGLPFVGGLFGLPICGPIPCVVEALQRVILWAFS